MTIEFGMPPIKKVNYLNNKDMLKEIHKSKNSFCEYIEPKYQDYDVIVENKEDVFKPNTQQKAIREIDNKEIIIGDFSIIEQAQINRSSRLASQAYELAVAKNTSREKPKLVEFKIDAKTIPITDLVFRIHTFEHILEAPGRKKNPKSEADEYAKLNFQPFKHYVFEEDGISLREVGRSHSKDGKYCIIHGSITNKLAQMFILMVNKYAQRSNWRSYTYLDEMKGQALLQLAQMGLQFDEYKSDNPFSYYTASVSNSFTRVLNLEKKNQTLRDDLLINAGASPSFSRQLAIEEEIRKLREEVRDESREE